MGAKAAVTQRIAGRNVPYQRRNTRVAVSAINLSFQGRRYQTVDWGLGGFRIDTYDGKLKKDEEFVVDGIGPADEDNLIPVHIVCRAVRRNNEEFSGAFTQLMDNAYEILEALMLRRKKFMEKLKNS